MSTTCSQSPPGPSVPLNPPPPNLTPKNGSSQQSRHQRNTLPRLLLDVLLDPGVTCLLQRVLAGTSSQYMVGVTSILPGKRAPHSSFSHHRDRRSPPAYRSVFVSAFARPLDRTRRKKKGTRCAFLPDADGGCSETVVWAALDCWNGKRVRRKHSFGADDGGGSKDGQQQVCGKRERCRIDRDPCRLGGRPGCGMGSSSEPKSCTNGGGLPFRRLRRCAGRSVARSEASAWLGNVSFGSLHFLHS
jgi:hypothetical protein